MKSITCPDRLTVPAILKKKILKEKIVALTAYDYSTARLVDAAGVDVILVGDSLGSVFQGGLNTLSVTTDEMVYHCKAVSRAVERALLVVDMPFMSYQVSPEKALENAGRLVKEGKASAVKLEGGVHVAETVRRIVYIDIPVMGHIGLRPQSFHRMGGHKIQGREDSATRALEAGREERIIQDALALEEAGVFSIVIEGVDYLLAKKISRLVSVPTIGIGAGPNCDGQILVINDLLGMDPEFRPRFVKRYAEVGLSIREAVETYAQEVRKGDFPSEQYCFGVKAKKAKVVAI
jgi:3-methyl-2-oxobutanoate hydroxymethyltransferase